MHTGLSEEQRRQIEKMRRQSGRMPVYRKTAEKANDFSEKTEELPQNGSSFFTRLLAAMLLLALFLQFHLQPVHMFQPHYPSSIQTGRSPPPTPPEVS